MDPTVFDRQSKALVVNHIGFKNVFFQIFDNSTEIFDQNITINYWMVVMVLERDQRLYGLENCWEKKKTNFYD